MVDSSVCDQCYYRSVAKGQGSTEAGQRVMSELALEVGIFHKGSEEVHSKYRKWYPGLCKRVGIQGVQGMVSS